MPIPPTDVEILHRLLIEGVQDYAIFALGVDGTILSWNTGAQRLKGYSASEIIGQHFSVFYPPEDKAWNKPAYELEEAARNGRIEDEGWRIRKDGSRFWANVTIMALRNESGTLIGYGKVTRDFTERRKAETQAIVDAQRFAAEEARRIAAEVQMREMESLVTRLRDQTTELERRRAEAEVANRAKSDFLAAMSHELRTPLNAIGGYAELLDLGVRGSVNEDQRADLARIRRSQQHLLGIINDLLNFSRIEAGQIHYNPSRVQVGEALETVASMIAPQAATRGVTLLAPANDPKAAAWADHAKVEQILINLATNAVKFTRDGGSVELRGWSDATAAYFVVRDTGIGIPADKLSDIFEPFVQVGRSLTQPSEGTGLGLAISRDLARAMDGDLTVTSEINVGSTFTLTLPVPTAAPAAATRAAAAAE